MTLYVTSPNFDVLIVIIIFLLAKNHRENILQRTIATEPLERVAVDVLGPLPTERGNRFIIVEGDYFTKWMEAYILVKTTKQKQ